MQMIQVFFVTIVIYLEFATCIIHGFRDAALAHEKENKNLLNSKTNSEYCTFSNVFLPFSLYG